MVTEFTNSGPILGVLGIVLIFTYLNILFGQILICLDRQRALTVVMAAATLATIPLDLLFIPLCVRFFNNAALGGAFSFVVTELGMLVAMVRLLPRGALGRQDGAVCYPCFFGWPGHAGSRLAGVATSFCSFQSWWG